MKLQGLRCLRCGGQEFLPGETDDSAVCVGCNLIHVANQSGLLDAPNLTANPEIDMKRVKLAVAKEVFGLHSPQFWRTYQEVNAR